LNILWYFNNETFKNNNAVLEYRNILGRKIERDFLYGETLQVN
jgi:hypothetical protein